MLTISILSVTAQEVCLVGIQSCGESKTLSFFFLSALVVNSMHAPDFSIPTAILFKS